MLHEQEVAILLDEIESLRALVGSLRHDLARKYQHCKKLKAKINRQSGAPEQPPLLYSQSSSTPGETPGLSISETAPTTEEQITAFADQDAGWQNVIEGGYESSMDAVGATKSTLGSFLERPIRQSVSQWVVGQPFFYKFNPWKDFLENSFVRDKIANYELLRCKLNCKMVISGTKFHYGRALVSYNPLSGFDQVTVERNFIQQDLIQASQKPHFFLNPTKNTGGEMTLPFFWWKNYMSLSESEYENMGEIVIKSMSNLLHANEGDDPVTITIYLWAEDVVLTMPTRLNPVVPLVSQSGKLSAGNKSNSITAKDEYGSGIISRPAAVIAKAAGQLKVLPMIRPYAMATEMAAGAVGNICKLFGYSRPTIVSDIQLFKPNPTGNLSNVDAGDAAQKLTLDSKAEITLDTRVAGLDGVDQMGILDIAQRESYLTTFSWVPDEGADTLLWNANVTPSLFDVVNDEIHPTPMSYLAQHFEKWHGSIKFRFQIVKSDFHKGRLLVRFDPNSFASTVEYNTNYSRVVDIAEEDDFEIVVGWAQAHQWLDCGDIKGSVNFSDTNRVGVAGSEFNGALEVNVLNDLVCPSTDAPISINVFVSMCEDAKFAAPTTGNLTSLHVFKQVNPVLQSQSGMLDGTENPTNQVTDKPTGTASLHVIGEEGVEADETYKVWYGDPPTTIRELMKRYVYTRTWVPSSPAEGTFQISKLLNKDAPYYSGWDPDGIDKSTNNITVPLTICNPTFATWWTPCYAGVRGSRRKKYMFSYTGRPTTPLVTRGIFGGANNGTFLNRILLLGSVGNDYIQKWITSNFSTTSGNGAANTNLGINNTIEVELPFYQEYRFLPARDIEAQGLPSNSHQVVTTAATPEAIGPASSEFSTAFQQWDAVGEDFNLLFFTGCPIMYNYNISADS